MNCDAQSLLKASACYRCIPKSFRREVQIYLWCKIAGVGIGVIWTPSSQIVGWTDKSGPHGLSPGQDLYYFKSHADLPTVTLLTFNGSGLMTSITGLDSLPALNQLFCNNMALTYINLSGCKNLSTLWCQNNFISALDVSPCVVLSDLQCYNNSLTSLNIGTSSSFVSVDAHTNALPAGPNGVNQLLVNLATYCLGNNGNVDSTVGTNSPPTVGPPNGLAAKASLTLNGWTVSTN